MVAMLFIAGFLRQFELQLPDIVMKCGGWDRVEMAHADGLRP
jgi:hypothetical protein